MGGITEETKQIGEFKTQLPAPAEQVVKHQRTDQAANGDKDKGMRKLPVVFQVQQRVRA